MVMPANSSLERMPKLTIEHDAPGGDSKAAARRRSIALRLDGKAWLRVEPEAFGELDVSAGQEIDASRRAEVETALARARARLFVVRSLAVKMQSTAEIERKLAARDVPADIAQEAIERVVGYGYLDDATLAGQLARGMRSRGYGRRRAERKLRDRGLRGPGADAALEEAYGDPLRTMRIVVAPSHSLPAAASRPVRHGQRSDAPAGRDRFRLCRFLRGTAWAKAFAPVPIPGPSRRSRHSSARA
jgi:SOS response regulatory protein OraA/RecX